MIGVPIASLLIPGLSKVITTFSGIASVGLFMAGLGFSLATLLAHASRKLYVEEDSRIGFKSFFQDAANS